MRVAVVAESYLPYVSGVTVSTETLARGLGARGHDVLVVAPRPARGRSPGTAGAVGPEPAYAWLRSFQLPLAVPPAYRLPYPLGGAALRRALRFRPEVVHVQSPFVAGHVARRLARAANAPLVFTHHTRFAAYRHYLGPLGAAAGGLLTAHLRRFWSACDAVIAPAADLADEIRAALPPTATTVVRAIPTGIDVAAIRALAPIDPRPLAGWEPDAVVAAVLGRLAPEKSADVVITAVAHARDREPALRLLVIGDGPSRAGLEVLARAWLGSAAWFAGARSRPEAIGLLRGSDLFVFASLTETQGIVLAEAQAAGLPAVVLDGPGVRASVRHGVDGLVVPNATPDAAGALGDALAALVGDRSRLGSLAERAAADATRFDVSASLAQVESLYAEVLARRLPGA